jgi:O-acetylhomoserine (thiol)-lyase
MSPKAMATQTRLVHNAKNDTTAHIKEPVSATVHHRYVSKEIENIFQKKQQGFPYSRQGNECTAELERLLTDLHRGVGSVVFSSGMAAISHAFFTLLKAGDHVIASNFVFGNTRSLLNTLQAFGVEVSWVDPTSVVNVEEARRNNTRLIFVESIANPMTQIPDLVGLGVLARNYGLVYIVDNTITTPIFCTPRDVGASLVIESLTKYIGGHAQSLGGSLTDTGLYDWTRYPHFAGHVIADPSTHFLGHVLAKGRRDMGGCMSAQTASDITRGAETLALRMMTATANACALAAWLVEQPEIDVVHHPSLPSHPQYDRARGVFGGSGALVSFELGSDLDLHEFLDALRLIVIATHIGDTRTLILHMASTVFFEVGPDVRSAMGISNRLIRMSVGIEQLDDLRADITHALR